MISRTNRDGLAARADRVAIVYGATAGVGGLGNSVAAGITAAANGGAEAFALGPGAASGWPLPGGTPDVTWIPSPPVIRPWMARYTWLRWWTGQLTMLHDRSLGKWASQEVHKLKPSACYLFTQVALETLRWARNAGVPTVLDNPNGHIRNYRQICERESERWFGKKFRGHPSPSMVDRVEEEYSLADRIRVYSKWGTASMAGFGVPESKIHIMQQTVNLDRFRPAAERPSASGPLNICYVGSLDLRKGFIYLLKAIRAVGAKHIRLRIAGATGSGLRAHSGSRKCRPTDRIRSRRFYPCVSAIGTVGGPHVGGWLALCSGGGARLRPASHYYRRGWCRRMRPAAQERLGGSRSRGRAARGSFGRGPAAP